MLPQLTIRRNEVVVEKESVFVLVVTRVLSIGRVIPFFVFDYFFWILTSVGEALISPKS